VRLRFAEPGGTSLFAGALAPLLAARAFTPESAPADSLVRLAHMGIRNELMASRTRLNEAAYSRLAILEFTNPKSVLIIGAGPAGLTAAYVLAKARANVTVLERDPEYVGGIARTAIYKGYRFDIGGHRFFSKSKEIEDLWSELLPHDLLDRPRSSRIYYGGRFYSYPLKAWEALENLGLLEASRCLAAYARARVFPHPDPRTFEDWVTNQFGSRLFQIFFKTYTEKVWGIPCSEISADWAAQRIQGLSLGHAIYRALMPSRRTAARGEVVKTLIDSFRYPRLGPGMMWEACRRRVEDLGGSVRLGHKVTRAAYDPDDRLWTVTHVDAEGRQETSRAGHVISSAPLRELARALVPPLSPSALAAANALQYRDFLTVVLIAPEEGKFQDNWIYVHDPTVKVGRIQNFKSWSPEMVPDPKMACYGLEYFCFEGDGLWSSSDEDLLQRGKREMSQLGLLKASAVVDGCVVRQRKAYPVYDDRYAANVNEVRREIEARFPGLHLVGRNGMHKYNNQDHAMMTAILCAKNILAGETRYDLWAVNQDAEYLEAGERGADLTGSGLRDVPRRVARR
jgi:protoporphyrinogen oxidase